MNNDYYRNSLQRGRGSYNIQPVKVPILSPEEIQKLNQLKRASITNNNNNKPARQSIRPSNHINSHQPHHNMHNNCTSANKPQPQYGHIRRAMKDDSHDTLDTRMPQTRKVRAIQQEEESLGEKCCRLLQNQKKYDNPYREARIYSRN